MISFIEKSVVIFNKVINLIMSIKLGFKNSTKYAIICNRLSKILMIDNLFDLCFITLPCIYSFK